MAEYPVFRGWDIIGRATRGLKQSITNFGKSSEARHVEELAQSVANRLKKLSLDDVTGRQVLATTMAENILDDLVSDDTDISELPFFNVLANCLYRIIEDKALFAIPSALTGEHVPDRSEIWEVEDQLKKTSKILDDFDAAIGDIANMLGTAIAPIVTQHPHLVRIADNEDELTFPTKLIENIRDLPEIIETMVQLPFAPEFDAFDTTVNLRARLEYNLVIASGGMPDVN